MIIKRIEEDFGRNDGSLRIIGIKDTTMHPKEAVIPHSHEKYEEIYYILEGQGEIFIDNKKQEVIQGDVIYIPPKSKHTMKPIGNNPLRFITVTVDITNSVRKRLSYIG